MRASCCSSGSTSMMSMWRAGDHWWNCKSLMVPFYLQKPFLQLKLRDRGNSRSKRNLPNLDCDSDSTEERCCRYKLDVDFENFGWDWIIAPKRYQAYFCSGECSFVFMQRYPHSHVIQQAVGNGDMGGPCCAPVKFSPISMLYFDDSGNIVYGTLPGMVVDRCGCS